MHISGLTIAVILFDMIIGIAVPVLLAVFIGKKTGAGAKPFFIGAAVMVAFALILEQIFHSVILATPAGKKMQGNFWWMALYGGLAAGLFEETGRMLAMKYCLKKEQDRKANALMYGAGHGGIEMMVLLFSGMINNLIFSVMINLGKVDLLLAPLDEVTRAALSESLTELATISPAVLLISPLERLAALCAQIALSVIVWYGVCFEKKASWYFLAVFLHFLLDAAAAISNGLGLPLMVTELLVWILSLLIALIAKKLYRRMPG